MKKKKIEKYLGRHLDLITGLKKLLQPQIKELKDRVLLLETHIHEYCKGVVSEVVEENIKHCHGLSCNDSSQNFKGMLNLEELKTTSFTPLLKDGITRKDFKKLAKIKDDDDLIGIHVVFKSNIEDDNIYIIEEVEYSKTAGSYISRAISLTDGTHACGYAYIFRRIVI